MITKIIEYKNKTANLPSYFFILKVFLPRTFTRI